MTKPPTIGDHIVALEKFLGNANGSFEPGETGEEIARIPYLAYKEIVNRECELIRMRERVEALERGLEDIVRFGRANPGCGYTASKMAEKTLLDARGSQNKEAGE